MSLVLNNADQDFWTDYQKNRHPDSEDLSFFFHIRRLITAVNFEKFLWKPKIGKQNTFTLTVGDFFQKFFKTQLMALYNALKY